MLPWTPIYPQFWVTGRVGPVTRILSPGSDGVLVPGWGFVLTTTVACCRGAACVSQQTGSQGDHPAGLPLPSELSAWVAGVLRCLHSSVV
uniref:Unnamed protein product n=3 Tax=Macaca TaxID=9539 RepID=Q9N0C2_MACFA|nr:unnamed protein product [Macaca fascicularis]